MYLAVSGSHGSNLISIGVSLLTLFYVPLLYLGLLVNLQRLHFEHIAFRLVSQFVGGIVAFLGATLHSVSREDYLG